MCKLINKIKAKRKSLNWIMFFGIIVVIITFINHSVHKVYELSDITIENIDSNGNNIKVELTIDKESPFSYVYGWEGGSVMDEENAYYITIWREKINFNHEESKILVTVPYRTEKIYYKGTEDLVLLWEIN